MGYQKCCMPKYCYKTANGQESIICNFQHHPKTGLKYLHHLHDNAPAHTAPIVTEFLESEKVNVLPHPSFSPDLAPCDYFLFPELKFHLSGKRYKSRNALGSAVYQFLMGVPIQDHERCSKIGLTT